MKIIKELLEARQETYGLVFTRDNETGEFEDVELIDYATDNILSEPSHARNMMAALIEVIKEKNAWDQFEGFVGKNSRQAKRLGPDFGDTENFTITKYGPFSADELGYLQDKLGA